MHEALRVAREAAGLTQAELADLCGVSRLTVVRWETGVSEPRVGMRKVLMEHLGPHAPALQEQLQPVKRLGGADDGAVRRRVGGWDDPAAAWTPDRSRQVAELMLSARHRNGWSTRDAARRAALAVSTWSRAERGHAVGETAQRKILALLDRAL